MDAARGLCDEFVAVGVEGQNEERVGLSRHKQPVKRLILGRKVIDGLFASKIIR